LHVCINHAQWFHFVIVTKKRGWKICHNLVDEKYRSPNQIALNIGGFIYSHDGIYWIIMIALQVLVGCDKEKKG
jgi:hypothetical protein